VRNGFQFLFAIRSSVPSHVGILIGGEKILRHPPGRKPVDPAILSLENHYQRWRRYAVRWTGYG
jgi:cell wall-associated NlpC family hydrolase